MKTNKHLACMLLLASALTAACSGSEDSTEEEQFKSGAKGVFILNEGNYQSGNATLSYYDPETQQVENGVFQRANGRRLGDTGQSITIRNGTAYIAVENSGIVWGIDVETFKVRGQVTASSQTQMISPRYIHFVSDTKAYVTDLYSPYVNIFNPQSFQWIGAISTNQESSQGYASTEEMVQIGKYVYTNCWSYSNKILAIDTERDEMVREIVLDSWQPKSMKADRNGKLWVITDGGYKMEKESFGDNVPHLYRIDAATGTIEMNQALDSDEANVQIAMNADRDILYIINNDIYRMGINDPHVPVRPFISAPVDSNGRRHKLYGIGVNPHNDDIYVADAVDYSQSGVVYRYSSDGQQIDQFRVGINPSHFAFW